MGLVEFLFGAGFRLYLEVEVLFGGWWVEVVFGGCIWRLVVGVMITFMMT